MALVAFTALRIVTTPPPHDAYQYWSFSTVDPYGGASLGGPAFLYSPVAAQLLAPFHVLPWPVFLTTWMLLLLGAAVYLLRTPAFVRRPPLRCR